MTLPFTKTVTKIFSAEYKASIVLEQMVGIGFYSSS